MVGGSSDDGNHGSDGSAFGDGGTSGMARAASEAGLANQGTVRAAVMLVVSTPGAQS